MIEIFSSLFYLNEGILGFGLCSNLFFLFVTNLKLFNIFPNRF